MSMQQQSRYLWETLNGFKTSGYMC